MASLVCGYAYHKNLLSIRFPWGNFHYTVSHVPPLVYGILVFNGMKMPEYTAKLYAFFKALIMCCQDLVQLQCILKSFRGETVSNTGPGIDSSQQILVEYRK